MNGAVGRCLAGSAMGALIALAFVPPAAAQWAPPWGAAFPGEIERNLEAQGYLLMAPLMRRPGVYLADVSAGPAGRQRLIIDATSGQVLERFPFPGRTPGPALAARDDAFGDTQPSGAGPPFNSGFSGEPPVVAPTGKSETPAGAKAHSKAGSIERKAPATKPASSPPLPPPAPREAARQDGSGSVLPAAAPTSQRTATEDSDKPKVSIVPAGAFE